MKVKQLLEAVSLSPEFKADLKNLKLTGQLPPERLLIGGLVFQRRTPLTKDNYSANGGVGYEYNCLTDDEVYLTIYFHQTPGGKLIPMSANSGIWHSSEEYSVDLHPAGTKHSAGYHLTDANLKGDMTEDRAVEKLLKQLEHDAVISDTFSIMRVRHLLKAAGYDPRLVRPIIHWLLRLVKKLHTEEYATMSMSRVDDIVQTAKELGYPKAELATIEKALAAVGK